MRTNLSAILSAAAVAALLASPAMAKAPRHHHAASSTVYIPSDARGSVTPYGTSERAAPRSNPYASDSQGYQSYPNPDRVFPAPDHYYN
jgi:hypothetical protein